MRMAIASLRERANGQLLGIVPPYFRSLGQAGRIGIELYPGTQVLGKDSSRAVNNRTGSPDNPRGSCKPVGQSAANFPLPFHLADSRCPSEAAQTAPPEPESRVPSIQGFDVSSGADETTNGSCSLPEAKGTISAPAASSAVRNPRRY